ncbi:MAG: metallophosphoesterase [Symploca sp. SIO3C6]|uniref:Metallophosphoesterase n=1 Tax=Symploca sp. SIO1C4 TaxID=2607765 RepID=A0A6B3N1D4_9CYAN|nr:metallophosphoesterase [Symploca sp. SIO3C6]NER27486.1 metallophosphoesterase [Symploca sp. SIO1C4]
MNWRFSEPLSIENVKVAIANLPNSLQGTKLVQLSDFHYDGFRLSEKVLAQAIAATNEAQPDLVVLTGDYVTHAPEPIYELVKHLKYLQSRTGVYAVLGNHDLHHRDSKAKITNALTSIGVRVLWNEVAYPLGPELPLVGLADFSWWRFNPAPIMNQLDPKKTCIILSHNPDSAEFLQPWRVDLQLSGHTHGGQIVIPGLGPLPKIMQILQHYLPRAWRRRIPYMSKCSNIVKHWEWSQGLHQVGANQLYVNRGLGTYSPGRLFCPPEVTILVLKSC